MSNTTINTNVIVSNFYLRQLRSVVKKGVVKVMKNPE